MTDEEIEKAVSGVLDTIQDELPFRALLHIKFVKEMRARVDGAYERAARVAEERGLRASAAYQEALPRNPDGGPKLARGVIFTRATAHSGAKAASHEIARDIRALKG